MLWQLDQTEVEQSLWVSADLKHMQSFEDVCSIGHDRMKHPVINENTHIYCRKIH